MLNLHEITKHQSVYWFKQNGEYCWAIGPAGADRDTVVALAKEAKPGYRIEKKAKMAYKRRNYVNK